MLQKHRARKEAKWYDHFRPKTQTQHMKQQDAMMLHLNTTADQLLDQSALQLQLAILPEGPARAQALQDAQSRVSAINACQRLQQRQARQEHQQLQQEQLMNSMMQEQQQQYDELQRHGAAGNEEDAGLLPQHA